MKPIEIHIEGYRIVISKDGEQPDILKDKQDEKITMPSYPVYPTTPQNPDQFKYPIGENQNILERVGVTPCRRKIKYLQFCKGMFSRVPFFE